MEVSSWWLLALPVVFGLGWVSHYFEQRTSRTAAKAMPEAYFRGLNNLLNNKPDEAIAAFEIVAQLDPETVDLYFALAKLFRRRGEQDRAIRIHRNLLERADLPQAAREQALYELAQDYLNAGIFDRSEAAFKELAGTPFAAQAEQHLARLYEKENNWAAALAHMQQFLQSANNTPLNELQRAREDASQYACELASQALASGNAAAAQPLIEQARALDANNSRTALLAAQWALKNNDATAALQNLNRGVIAKPSLAPHAVQLLAQAQSLSELSGDALAQVVQWCIQYPEANSLRKVLSAASPEQAGLLLSALAQHVKLKPLQAGYGAAKLLTEYAVIYSNHAEAGNWKNSADLIQTQLSASLTNPVCSHCGFRAKRHQWRCPGCNRWGGIGLGAV